MTSLVSSVRLFAGIAAVAAIAIHQYPCGAQTAPAPASAETTATENLTPEEWRSLPQEERRARSRRNMITRYEPTGKPTADKLSTYLERYASFNVYDPRYYLFKVSATPVEGTTGTVKLTGDVYPANYRGGVEDLLKSLTFDVASNDIRALPLPDMGYGVSTTGAATIRKEPRRNSEQVNSVGLGGWVRFLRDASASDVTPETHSRRRAPGAEGLPENKPEDWALAQSMEGYIGYVRKADFAKENEYRLPEGIIRKPVNVDNWQHPVPAGAFVYAAGDTWKLYDGTPIPTEASVRDLRPTYKAEEIEALMHPFMETEYVWGGVTDEGIDCSGFSQYFMRTEGVLIPRDAVQQATGGLIVGWGLEQIIRNAKPGDLVFFANDSGRIGHVAISLGGSKIIHSAGRGVHITELDKPSENDEDGIYGSGAIFARRIMVR